MKKCVKSAKKRHTRIGFKALLKQTNEIILMKKEQKMLKKEDLENLEKLKSERNSLIERINKLKGIPQKILIDGVRGSSKSFPYTQHTMKIERIR